MPGWLELLGRSGLDVLTSGVDASGLATRIADLHPDARADRDGFLADLHALVAADTGGFATYGAARLVWELYGGEALTIPATWPLIDGGIDFKLARGLPSATFTGYEWQRYRERAATVADQPPDPTPSTPSDLDPPDQSRPTEEN
jgi:hypothetical protein